MFLFFFQIQLKMYIHFLCNLFVIYFIYEIKNTEESIDFPTNQMTCFCEVFVFRYLISVSGWWKTLIAPIEFTLKITSFLVQRTIVSAVTFGQLLILFLSY